MSDNSKGDQGQKKGDGTKRGRPGSRRRRRRKPRGARNIGAPAENRQDSTTSKPQRRRRSRKPKSVKRDARSPEQTEDVANPTKQHTRRSRRRSRTVEVREATKTDQKSRAESKKTKRRQSGVASSTASSDQALREPSTTDPFVRPPERQAPIAETADDLVLELGIDSDSPEPEGKLANVVQVHFRNKSQNTACDAGELHVEAGEKVVIETDQGMVVGVASCRSCRQMIENTVPRMTRRLDHNDIRQQARNQIREKEAFSFCKERITFRNLPMKLICVEYLHSGNKAIFYFSAEHRVDFRELVKDLAQRLHTRIVMRQVGVRDEAKMTGGIGSCGNQLCCALWLSKFEPVSIRMAKDQNLVLNPQKVSGQCGRLKCCLTYEQEQYKEARKDLPKPGRRVCTPEGDGKVQDLDILCKKVSIQLEDGTVKSFPADQIKVKPSPPRKPAAE